MFFYLHKKIKQTKPLSANYNGFDASNVGKYLNVSKDFFSPLPKNHNHTHPRVLDQSPKKIIINQ